jgi:hypothetical protein
MKVGWKPGGRRLAGPLRAYVQIPLIARSPSEGPNQSCASDSGSGPRVLA